MSNSWIALLCHLPIYSTFFWEEPISWPNGAYVTSAFQKRFLPGVQIVQACAIYSLILMILSHYSQHFFLSQKQSELPFLSVLRRNSFTSQLTWLHVLTITGAVCSSYLFFFTNGLQCESKPWVIYVKPNSGFASGILHIPIVKTAVALVTSTPQ